MSKHSCLMEHASFLVLTRCYIRKRIILILILILTLTLILILILILWSYGECRGTVLSLHKNIVKLWTRFKLTIWDSMTLLGILLVAWWIDKISQHFYLLKHVSFLVLMQCPILKHYFKSSSYYCVKMYSFEVLVSAGALFLTTLKYHQIMDSV
jgi:hypothetical protein